MKRIAILLFALCLILCACNSKTPPLDTAVPTETTTTPTETTVPTEPPILYRHPLTGAPLDEAFTGRAIAVVINNLKGALPHHGVSNADILYEIETEGGITRCLAIYTDMAGVEKIGPVRSSRTFFNNIAMSYAAPIIHCGGSDRGIQGGYEDSNDLISNWEHINEQYNGSYFFRDKDRYYNQGYNWEHTLFATGDKLLQGISDKGYATEEVLDYGLQFDEEVQLGGFVANNVTVTFDGDKTSDFAYDETTGLYKMSQYGSIYIDANTKEQMTFKNVLALYTDQWKRRDTGYARSYYDLEGEGTGYLAVNGEIVKIKWSRSDLRAPFVYTLEDGTPVTLGVGTTYVAIANTSSTPIDYK